MYAAIAGMTPELATAAVYGNGAVVASTLMQASAATGAIMGAMNSMAAGGGGSDILSGTLSGGIGGALFSWAGGVGEATSFDRYAAHAVAGCVSAVADGGKCGQGAVSAVAGKWMTNHIDADWGHPVRFTLSAIAGGTISALGGGKFENGAMTAAMGYLFNHLVHENTASANGLHRRLVVRDGSGKALSGFSFFMTDDSNPFIDNFSKGSSSGVPRPGGSGNGEVLIDMVLPTTKTVDVFLTTPREDQLMVKYIQSRINDVAPYNALTNNCRDFSAAQFDYMKTEILRARAEGRDPKF